MRRVARVWSRPLGMFGGLRSQPSASSSEGGCRLFVGVTQAWSITPRLPTLKILPPAQALVQSTAGCHPPVRPGADRGAAC